MSVFVDIQGIQSRAHGERGIARYLLELSAALEREQLGRVVRYLLNRDLPVPGVLEPLTASARLGFNDRFHQCEARIYHVGSPFELGVPIDRIWPRAARTLRLAVTLYDMIPELFADAYLADTRVRARYRTRLGLLRRAHAILAISNSTATDAVELLGVRPDKVRVVGAGVSERFRPARSREDALAAARRTMPWLRPGYVLYTGGIDHRKNIDKLLEAYAALPRPLREQHHLVIVCRVTPEQRLALDSRLQALGVSEHVRFPGYVSDEALLLLYQATELFVFPSLYEGFGLPLAEAIACGAPAIAGRTSSLVELVDDELALFDPRDPRSIRQTLERSLTNPSLLARLRRKTLDERHTWTGVAGRTATAYDELLARPERPRRRRRRIAFVSPLPPQRSGVADESFRLLEALVKHCDIDAFVDDDFGAAQGPPRVAVHPIRHFEIVERARGRYDRVIYCLGNSEFHVRIVALLRERPGVVIAHDVRLIGLYSWCANRRPELEPRGFQGALQAMYGDRLPSSLGELGGLEYEQADRHGVYMAREAISFAERFLVHSQHAAQLARLDAAPGDEGKVGVFPYGVLAPEEIPKAASDSRTPLVATFGIVTPEKQVAKVVEAFAEAARTRPQSRLAIVGESPSVTYAQELSRQADELGVGDRVLQTGRLSERRFHSWIARASVAVQLRAISNGETSAVVARCLAGGVPTIVTAIGSARELPDACVAKVERDISPASLAAEIVDLLDDSERRAAMSEAGVAFARERSFEAVAEHLYETIVLGARPLEPYPPESQAKAHADVRAAVSSA